MGVVVQEMVQADVSGILFTANPTTGNRDEMLIEAAYRLGEEIVSGTVTPEAYRIDLRFRAVMDVIPGQGQTQESPPQTALATPEVITHPTGKRILDDRHVQELIELGMRVEKHHAGVPQDIEWAIGDGALWLLQARPITTLPAPTLPEDPWQSPIPGATWVRRQIVEHMPEPMSPLFADFYVTRGLAQSIHLITKAMGMEGLFARLVDGPFFTTVNGYGYSRANFPFNRQTIPLFLRSFVQGLPWLFRHSVAYWREEGLPRYMATLADWLAVDPSRASDGELMCGVRALAIADAIYWFSTAIAIGTAKVTDAMLDSFVRWAVPQGEVNSELFLRGFPSKTFEAAIALDAIGRRVRESPELRGYVTAAPAARLIVEGPRPLRGRSCARIWSDTSSSTGTRSTTWTS